MAGFVKMFGVFILQSIKHFNRRNTYFLNRIYIIFKDLSSIIFLTLTKTAYRRNYFRRIMKENFQKRNWILDIGLFIGFIAAFFLNWTGLELHQWIGMGAGAVAIYHLVAHWGWVKAVTRRFLSKSSGHAQLYYVLDAALLAGFAAILVTGLVISSWLNLSLVSAAAWRDVHIISSIATLLVLVLKIGLHWRWIQQRVTRHAAHPVEQSPVRVVEVAPIQTQPVDKRGMNRREFVKVMCGAGILSAIALNNAVRSIQTQAADLLTGSSASNQANNAAETIQTQAADLLTGSPASDQANNLASSSPTDEPTSTAEASKTVNTTNCTVRCNNKCSFPGRCRRYTDSNNNGRCDLGECL